jgi:hypothetical protein
VDGFGEVLVGHPPLDLLLLLTSRCRGDSRPVLAGHPFLECFRYAAGVERALHRKRAKSFPGPFDTGLTLTGYATREDWREVRTRCRLNEMRKLRRSSWLAQVANTVAFFASDLAGATAGTVFNPTSGTVVV